MEIVKNILIGIYVVICVALIVLVMKQSKDDAGASGAVVGGAQNSFYEKNKGRTKEGKLKRGTIILGVSFIIFTVILAIVYAM